MNLDVKVVKASCRLPRVRQWQLVENSCQEPCEHRGHQGPKFRDPLPTETVPLRGLWLPRWTTMFWSFLDPSPTQVVTAKRFARAIRDHLPALLEDTDMTEWWRELSGILESLDAKITLGLSY